MVKLCLENGKIHLSDFSGQLLVQVSPFLFTSPSNKKIQAISSGRSRVGVLFINFGGNGL